jgi:putative transposase
MGLPRSTFYDAPASPVGDGEILARVRAICDELEAYGYRRVGAALRQQGLVVNSKKIRRLMREHALQPRHRRRYVATTDSDHDGPIFPNLAKDKKVDGPDQLWVADMTYIAIATGFVYLAAILDAWSRRVVGYAISRSIDHRLALAALKAAIRVRRPAPGCVHHSDRGSQYAAEAYRQLLAEHGLVGSMGRRGNPYDNAQAESFMKTQAGRNQHAEGGGRLPDGLRDLRGCHRRPSPVHRRGLQHAASPFRARLSQPCSVRGVPRPAAGQSRRLNLSTLRGALQ